jgi:hypothetical protein
MSCMALNFLLEVVLVLSISPERLDEVVFLNFVGTSSSAGHVDDLVGIKPCHMDPFHIVQVLSWWGLVHPLSEFEWSGDSLSVHLYLFRIQVSIPILFIACFPMEILNVHDHCWFIFDGIFNAAHAFILAHLIPDILC